MLSRAANSVYWMGRYIERAENLARFIEVTLSFELDCPESTVDQWEPLVRATGDDEYFKEKYGEFTSQNVRKFLTFDTDYSASIRTSINCARENARTVRETISSEAWEQLNALYHFIRDADGDPDAIFYDELVEHCYLFTGILNSTMTRGTAWHFANIGELLERADKTSRILDVKYFTLLRAVSDVDTPFDDLVWSTVLRSTCGFEMFRKQYRGITVPRIARFLILDSSFPRAIRYCVEQLRHSIRLIVSDSGQQQSPPLVLVDEIIEQLSGLDANSIIDCGMHEFIDGLQKSLNRLGESIHETFFAERPIPGQRQQQQ